MYLRDINGENARGKSTSALIAMDPISISRFIQIKFDVMLEFLCSKNGPIGEVECYGISVQTIAKLSHYDLDKKRTNVMQIKQ